MNYWLDGDDEPVYKQYIRYQGQVSEGIVIGLFPDTNFWFEVQVFNTAGLGPLSEKFIQETLHEGMDNNYVPLDFFFYYQFTEMLLNAREIIRRRFTGVSELKWESEYKIHTLNTTAFFYISIDIYK